MKNTLKSMLRKILIISVLIISYSQINILAVDRTTNIDKNLVDKSIKEESRYLNIDVKYPQVVKLSTGKKINKEIEESIFKVIDEVKAIIKDYYGHGEEGPMFPYQIESNYYVTNTDNVLSFYYEIYQFTGGAHGMTTRYSYNIDEKTGEVLSLEKVFKTDEYETIINNEIQKQIDENKYEYFIGKDGFNGINEKTKFYVNGDYVVVYFQQYEIAPYVKGIPEFKIKFKNIH